MMHNTPQNQNALQQIPPRNFYIHPSLIVRAIWSSSQAAKLKTAQSHSPSCNPIKMHQPLSSFLSTKMAFGNSASIEILWILVAASNMHIDNPLATMECPLFLQFDRFPNFHSLENLQGKLISWPGFVFAFKSKRPVMTMKLLCTNCISFELNDFISPNSNLVIENPSSTIWWTIPEIKSVSIRSIQTFVEKGPHNCRCYSLILPLVVSV